jgi:hypothetical protein
MLRTIALTRPEIGSGTSGCALPLILARWISFSEQDIKDLRDMREHVIKYFKGEGWFPQRWVIETPEYRADASARNGTMLGGRLDWVAFGAAAERLLPQLLAEPIPWPSPPVPVPSAP